MTIHLAACIFITVILVFVDTSLIFFPGADSSFVSRDRPIRTLFWQAALSGLR